jgi:hypothetical protein
MTENDIKITRTDASMGEYKKDPKRDTPSAQKTFWSGLKWNNRAIHRDLGYFYLGLIISFALSGILLNHRLDWHLDQYTVSTKDITVNMKQDKSKIADSTTEKPMATADENGGRRNKHNGRHGAFRMGNKGPSDNPQGEKAMISETFAQDFAKRFGITDSLRRQFIQKDKIRLSFVNHNVEINIKTGKGRITEFRRTPFLSQMVQLHRNNTTTWICFSDSFAICLIIISITGVLLPEGKKSFRRRGWILTVAGLIFPLIVLFFLI